jgi:heme exporter protein D
MSFAFFADLLSSFADFLAMGGHGLYIWSAYGISLLILGFNVGVPLLAKRRYLQEQARRLRREESK